MHGKEVNPFPIDKFQDWSKLKAIAGNTSNVAERLKFVLERVENIMGKGVSVGGRLKSGLCGKEFVFVCCRETVQSVSGC